MTKIGFQRLFTSSLKLSNFHFKNIEHLSDNLMTILKLQVEKRGIVKGPYNVYYKTRK